MIFNLSILVLFFTYLLFFRLILFNLISLSYIKYQILCYFFIYRKRPSVLPIVSSNFQLPVSWLTTISYKQSFHSPPHITRYHTGLPIRWWANSNLPALTLRRDMHKHRCTTTHLPYYCNGYSGVVYRFYVNCAKLNQFSENTFFSLKSSQDNSSIFTTIEWKKHQKNSEKQEQLWGLQNQGKATKILFLMDRYFGSNIEWRLTNQYSRPILSFYIQHDDI